jgi:hypothetical protein
LDTLAESVEGVEAIVALSPFYFLIFIFPVLFILLSMTTAGAIRIRRRSVLELLQDNTSIRQKDKKTANMKNEDYADSDKTGIEDSKYISPSKQDVVSSKFMDMGSSASNFTQFNYDALPLSEKEKLKNRWYYIYSHILRSKIKSGLAFSLALLFLLVLSFLQESINNIQLDIDRLYDTTVVRGEIMPPPLLGGLPSVARLSKGIPDMLLETSFLQNDLFKAGYDNLMVIPVDSEGELPYNWDEQLGINKDMNWEVVAGSDYVIAFNDIEDFTIAHSRILFDDAVIRLLPDGRFMEDFHIDFAEGFDASSFEYVAGEPIPIIMAAERDSQTKPIIDSGARVYLGVDNGRGIWQVGEWHYLPAIVIGTHNKNILIEDNYASRELVHATLMPIPALEALKGEEVRYISIEFEINPSWNKQLDKVEEELGDIVHQARMHGESLILHLHDEELRAVVMPLEENLVLLQNLYPIAISLLVVIALIFYMILILQNAKNAAIMRVLGMTKKDSRLTLWLKNMITCSLGLLMGLFIVLLLNWGFGVSSTLSLMGLFFISSALGSVLGAILITNRAPLDLLQVKE